MGKSAIYNLRSKIFLSARLARRTMRRFNQVRRYGSAALANTPIFIANSFPKSGTHLLTQVMQGFTRIGPAVDSGLPAIVTFEGDTGRQRPADEILSDLKRLLPGDIAYGHLHALPEVVSFLCQDGVAPYFILRDPRDVVVSHVHYVTEMEVNHIHHYYYREVLESFDERLKTSILGIQNTKQQSRINKTPGIPFPDIRARFEPFMGWLGCSEVLVLHFEEFITDQNATMEQILVHAEQHGFSSSYERQAALQVLAESIDPQRSPTFRSGKIGGWRASFTEEHKQIFKNVTGDLLVRLGYEEDDNW